MEERIATVGKNHPPCPLSYTRMLTKIELDLQSLFGLHVRSCIHWLRPRNPPPPHLGSYTRTLLVSQGRRHLFVTPCLYCILKANTELYSLSERPLLQQESYLTSQHERHCSHLPSPTKKDRNISPLPDSSVADPGCLSRIRIFPPDPGLKISRIWIRIKFLSIFNLKNWYQVLKTKSEMFIPDPRS